MTYLIETPTTAHEPTHYPERGEAVVFTESREALLNLTQDTPYNMLDVEAGATGTVTSTFRGLVFVELDEEPRRRVMAQPWMVRPVQPVPPFRPAWTRPRPVVG